jgi:hypothetical protein
VFCTLLSALVIVFSTFHFEERSFSWQRRKVKVMGRRRYKKHSLFPHRYDSTEKRDSSYCLSSPIVPGSMS